VKISLRGRWCLFLAWRAGVIPFRVAWWGMVSSTYEQAMTRCGMSAESQRRAIELSKSDVPL
jgi:hypothetical protein